MTGGELNLAAFEPDGRVFWHAVDGGRLELQLCLACDRLRFPPSEWCNRCGSTDHSWKPLSGRGSVYSWTITHHAPRPEFAADVPFALVMVQLDEQDDIVHVGRFIGKPEQLVPGLQLVATYTPVAGGTLVAWKPLGQTERAREGTA